MNVALPLLGRTMARQGSGPEGRGHATPTTLARHRTIEADGDRLLKLRS
jgi:hypothetical protein